MCAFQLVNGGRCFSDTSQHDWGSRFSSHCCPRLEQPTVVCHISVVTVDFQATFKDVLVRSVVLNAPTSVLLLPVFPYLPNTSFFFVFWYVTCPCSFWTKHHVNLFVNNNNNNNNNCT